MALEDDSGGNHGEMPAPVGPPDAPGSQESNREEAEVEEQRERVALRQQDPNGVQQLRVLRVEPVREDRLGVVQPGDGVALRHVRREGHVVPERVEVEDPSVQRILGRQSPVGEDKGDDPNGDQPRQGPFPPLQRLFRGWHGGRGVEDSPWTARSAPLPP